MTFNSSALPFPYTGLPIEDVSSYHYLPTEWICILFVVLFSISTLLHLGQALYFRLWYLHPTIVLAGIGEIIGWSGRLWSSINILNGVSFLMQISTTIIAPTFLTAANFIIFGQVVRLLGPQYSRLSPGAYTKIFLSADLLALVIQAAGGGLASSAQDPTTGGHIMLGGIAIQMAAITIYTIIAVECISRYVRDKPVRGPAPAENMERIQSEASEKNNGQRGVFTGKLKLMVLALGISTLFIFMRSVYRVIELSDGWNGRIISTQVYFNVLEGMPVCIAMYTINFLHPGFLLPRRGEFSEVTRV